MKGEFFKKIYTPEIQKKLADFSVLIGGFSTIETSVAVLLVWSKPRGFPTLSAVVVDVYLKRPAAVMDIYLMRPVIVVDVYLTRPVAVMDIYLMRPAVEVEVCPEMVEKPWISEYLI